MENPFELILEKLNVIEKSILSLQRQLNNKTSNELELMTVTQVAEYLNSTKGTIYGLVHMRKIPVIKKGRLYFSKEDINKWLLKFKQPTTHELNEETNEYIMKNNIF